MEYGMNVSRDFNEWSDHLWDLRDKRVDGWFMLDSFWPTLLLVAAYLFIVKIWGPRFMENRPAYNINTFLIYYNACQVGLSAYIFVQLLRGGWGVDYSFRCQPVDTSQSPKAMLFYRGGWGSDYSLRCQPVDYSQKPKALLMLHACHMYYLSKFSEFIDTFCFVARKKFNQVSLLHVVHHGIMPMSVWPGARYLASGHSSFFGLLNTFVHIVMYFYYMMSAMGPQYQKYLWWKQHLTTLQMVQFVGIMVHAFQLIFYDDCDFPWQFAYYIGAHALLFFALFSQFYLKNYSKKTRNTPTDFCKPKVEDANANFKEDHMKTA